MKYKVTLNKITYEVEVTDGEAVLLNEFEAVAPAPAAVSAPQAATAPSAAPTQAAPQLASGEVIKSPMPGTIVNVKFQTGAAVKKGDTLVVLEAMKMENEIKAGRDGKIVQVLVAKGAAVETGTALVVLG